MNLVNNFLISMPNVHGDIFEKSVILICEHDQNGAVGVVINKSCGLNLAALFSRINLKLTRADLLKHQVFVGGPVQLERGFVLHEKIIPQVDFSTEEMKLLSSTPIYTASIQVHENLELTTSFDVLESIAMDAGPQQVFFALGCAAWAGGQLEAEINANMWLTAPSQDDLIFTIPVEQRYEKALALIGIKEEQIVNFSGKA